jgi:hypothetical protein
MARPTKRKTKHRGNAAGMIEARGVTHARSGGSTGARGGGRVDPRMREPSWKSAFIRAVFAAVVFAVVMLLVLKGKPLSVVFTAIFLVALYTPFGFYFDTFIYKRRLAKLGVAAPAAKPSAGSKPSASSKPRNGSKPSAGPKAPKSKR